MFSLSELEHAVVKGGKLSQETMLQIVQSNITTSPVMRVLLCCVIYALCYSLVRLLQLPRTHFQLLICISLTHATGFKTTGLIPQVVIRQSKYDIPVPQKDFRLLFALNCGSLSMPASVPVFCPEALDDQLDECVR